MRSLKPTMLLLSLFVGFFLLLDLVAGVSVNRDWTFGFILVGVGLGALGTRGTAPKRRALVLLGYAALILLIRYTAFDSRKPFLRDLYSLEPGMTVAEVDKIMGDYMHGTGWTANPLLEGTDGGAASGTITDAQAGPIGKMFNGDGGQLEIEDSIVYRHTNEGWGNSDWGVVRFSGGRVVSVNFYPD